MATSYLTPGVYVEEVDKGSKPIAGVGTAVAAFVGVAEKGPSGSPVMVTNWTQYTDAFGGFVPGAYLAHAVYGYFNNGGGLCYVIRVGGEGAATAVAGPAATASIAAKTGAQPALKAAAKGDASAPTSVEIAAGDDDSYTVTVRRGSTEEKYDDLVMAKGAKNLVEVVNKASQLVTLELGAANAAPAPGTYPLAAAATATKAVAKVNPERTPATLRIVRALAALRPSKT